MHEVSAAWLMTLLTTKPLLVALVQATSALSICTLAIPAGALANILDRRRYLLVLQSWMMCIAAILAIMAYMGKITPQSLLFLTFCLGAGTALIAPTWQATIPDLVPSKDLVPAITLNSMGVNFARTLGPILAGIIIAISGPALVFALNAISFLGIIIILKRWKRQQPVSTLPTERLFGAMRSGIRYVRGSPMILKVLIKSSANFVFISAAWALLPLIARVMLHKGSVGYGVLLGMLGLGAVCGALANPKVRAIFNVDQRILTGGYIFGLSLLLIAIFNQFYLTCFAMFCIGFAWISVLASLSAVVQQSVPPWVRARAVSVYFMVFFGGLALGGVIWGIMITHISMPTTLTIAGLCLLVTNTWAYRLPLAGGTMYDHTPSMDLPAPTVEKELDHDEGPIMVSVEYEVDPINVVHFLKAIKELRLTRIRDGAFFWTLFNDIQKPNRYFECFMVESWLEHLRFHERISISDRKIQDKVNSLHKGPHRPKTTHFVACELPIKNK